MNQLDDQILDVTGFSYQELIGRKTEWTPKQNPRNVTASGNVNALDDEVRVDCTAAAVTMTLETAVGCDGRQHTFKKIDASANAMIIDGAGSETIDGAATLSSTTRYMTYVIKSNGTNWDLVASGTATVNANLTGPITSVGNATSIASGNTYPTPTFSGTATAAGLLDISGASAGQIKFPAAQNASADANTLDDYEEGTWTPSDGSGAGLSLTIGDATYTKVGRLVLARTYLTYPVTANAADAVIAGLPFTSAHFNAVACNQNTGVTVIGQIQPGGTTILLENGTTAAAVSNLQMSAKFLVFSAVYSI